MPASPSAHPSGPDLSFHVDLPCAEGAAALARRATAEVLTSWGVTDEDRVYDVLLLCSELVSNAVRHCGRRVELSLSLAAGVLTVEVGDGSPALPAQRSGELEESGRGLTIVEALALAWGVRTDDDGKAVWATVQVGPAGDDDAQAEDTRALA